MFLVVTCQHASGACQSHSRPGLSLREASWKYVELSPSTLLFLTLQFHEKDLTPTPNLLQIWPMLPPLGHILSLDHGAESNPCLIWGSQAIPFLKWPDVESGGEEETDGVGDKLPIRIWVAAKEPCLCVFLNLAEKDLRGIRGQVGVLENSIVCLKDSWSRLAIYCA
jgi:hypothetical protein